MAPHPERVTRTTLLMRQTSAALCARASIMASNNASSARSSRNALGGR